MPIPNPVELDPAGLPIREVILEHLRRWIIEDILHPGEIIRDGEIAQAFGVSRTPVREALLQLRFEGLVETKPQGWTQVKPLDQSQIEHLLRIVMDLEMLAARLVAEQSNPDLDVPEQINQELKDLVEQTGDGAQGRDLAWRLLELNDRFHTSLVELTNNRFLIDTLSNLKTLMRRYERLYFNLATPIDRQSLAEHDELLAAIHAGDPNLAAEMAERNFQNAPLLAGRPRSEPASPQTAAQDSA